MSEATESLPQEPPLAAAPSRTTQAVVGLYANGWCASFAVAFLMLGGLTFGEGGGGLLVGSAAACLIATYFSLAVSPFLCRWRAAMRRSAFWPLSVLLSAGLLLWAALSWCLLLLVTPYAFGAGGGVSAAESISLSLDRILDGLALTVVGISWVAGMTACLLSQHALSQDPPYVYGGATSWRKALGLVLLVPYLLVLVGAGGVAWRGRQLDPGIEAAYKREIATALGQKKGDPEASAGGVPASFLAAAPVQLWLQPKPGQPRLDRKALLRTWCQEAAQLWTGDAFWNKPELIALARLARERHIAGLDPETHGVPAALLAELAVRCEVILVEWGGVDASTTQRLYEMELPANQWAMLVELGLSRTDLTLSAALDDSDVRDRFVNDAARVLSKGDYDMDGKLQRHFFQRSLEREQLNALWQAFQSGKPYPAAGTPPGVDEFRKRYASSLDFDLNAIDADIGQATFSEERNRQTLAYNIVMMELKRLRAEAAPMPQSLDELRPPVAIIAKAYAEWITLKSENGRIFLKQVEPHRNGMSLTHRF